MRSLLALVAAGLVVVACNPGGGDPAEGGAGGTAPASTTTGAAAGGTGGTSTSSGSGGSTGTGSTGTGGAGPLAVTLTTYERVGTAPAAAANPAFLAVRDGLGPWTRITGSAGVHLLEIADPAGRWGAALVCGEKVQVVEATVLEGSHVELGCSLPDGGATRKLTLAFADPTTCARLGFANVGTQGCGAPGTITVPTGPHDLLGLSATGPASGTPLRAYAARDVDVGAQTIDFQAAALSAPADVFTVSAAGPMPPYAALYTETSALTYGVLASGGAYGAMPDGLRRPGDVHVVTVTTGAGRVMHFFRHARDIDDTALPAEPAPHATAVGAGSITWSPYVGSGVQVAIGSYTMSVSAGWLAGASSYALPAAEVCALGGFPLPCLAAPAGTPYQLTGFRPVQSFVAALPEILTALALPTHARDGLVFATATEAGVAP